MGVKINENKHLTAFLRLFVNELFSKFFAPNRIVLVISEWNGSFRTCYAMTSCFSVTSCSPETKEKLLKPVITFLTWKIHRVCSIVERTVSSLKEALSFSWHFWLMCFILFCIEVGHAVWDFKTFSKPAAVEEEHVLKNDVLGLMKLEAWALGSTFQWEEHCGMSQRLGRPTDSQKIWACKIRSLEWMISM